MVTNDFEGEVFIQRLFYQVLAKMLPVAYLEKYAMEAFANVENQAAVPAIKK